MKNIRNLTILGALMFPISIVTYAQAYRDYDPFTRQSSIQSNSATEIYKRNLREQPCLMVSVKFKGKYPPKNPIVKGIFVSSGTKWKYLDYHDLSFLADGESVKILGEVVHEGAVHRSGWDEPFGFISEYITFKMEWEEFIKLADASKIEFKLGLNEFVLRSEELVDLRAFKTEVLK